MVLVSFAAANIINIHRLHRTTIATRNFLAESFARCKTIEDALFYLKKCATEGWSRNALMNCIKAHQYENLGGAITNFADKLPSPQSELAQAITKDTYDFGFISLEDVVPEDDDISLKERCRRVNRWCLLHGKQSAILVSIHVNTYGNGTQWTQPQGWSIYTSKGKTAADDLATNEQECRWLQTRAAKQAIVDLHVEWITEYMAG